MAGACAKCNAQRGPHAVSRHRLAGVLFWVIAGVSAVLLIFLALVVGGAIPIDSASPPAAPAPEAIAPPAVTPPSRSATTTEPATTAPAVNTARALEPTVVVLTAARGDSWFSARVGSEDGRFLDERVLAQGESVRLEARRIWLSVGAAGNVEVTVDGKPRVLAPGTVSLVLTPSI